MKFSLTSRASDRPESSARSRFTERNRVAASTPEFLFSVVGGYLTVEEAKDILDHVTVRFAPEA